MIEDELFYGAIDLLEELIAIPSLSRQESNAANVVEKYLQKEGIKTYRSGNNVWCLSNDFSTEKPTILLNSHIDTVKPAHGWVYDPFVATRDGDIIYGLGSNDAGASVVSLLTTFLALNKTNQSYNLIFLASCEEEVSGKDGVESVLPLLPKIDVAIVGEPTQMQPAIAEKGLMVLDGVVTGISGHAARNEGVNAIYNAIDVINQLRNLKFDRVSSTLGEVKISVTQIEAGKQHNVVPDICKIVVDVRTTDIMSNVETLEYIRQNVPNCSFTPRSTRLNPSSISENHPILERLITLGHTPFGSPTLSDQSLMPFESLKLGPGDSSRSHTADEYIEIPEIREAINTYYTLLDGLKL